MSAALVLDWNVPRLHERLAACLPGLKVEIQRSLASTNSSLLERARPASSFEPCLLVAEEQTQGRGRLGRGWWSRAGASLTFSVALPLAPADWAGLSLAVGVALADALDAKSASQRIALKWPNDLWLLDAPGRGRKLGGILIETVTAGSARICVVGVGLNVRPREKMAELAHGYACVQELMPKASPPEVLALVAEPLLRALTRFEAEGFAPLVAAYARRDLLVGQAVTTTLPELPEGICEGVDARGALLLRHRGRLRPIVSGEVSVRLAQSAEASVGRA